MANGTQMSHNFVYQPHCEHGLYSRFTKMLSNFSTDIDNKVYIQIPCTDVCMLQPKRNRTLSLTL